MLKTFSEDFESLLCKTYTICVLYFWMHLLGVVSGLNWTGLMDWATGLTIDLVSCLFCVLWSWVTPII